MVVADSSGILSVQTAGNNEIPPKENAAEVQQGNPQKFVNHIPPAPAFQAG